MNTNPLIPDRLPSWVADNLDAILAFEPLATPARGCFVPGCRRDAARAGLCRPHFVRAQDQFGTPPPSRRKEARRKQPEVAPTSDTEAGRKP